LSAFLDRLFINSGLPDLKRDEWEIYVLPEAFGVVAFVSSKCSMLILI
jgi:hypothetical protein